ncbi:MAG: DUF4367 domain-containing protein [Thaumarchaeota archaeon]|nr:DUF4367 domain-containing protein [Nitrososphaerota archaeon]MCL5317658.1 DUF4367 domain-containing protein [Nitrososphaerota archaeon]
MMKPSLKVIGSVITVGAIIIAVVALALSSTGFSATIHSSPVVARPVSNGEIEYQSGTLRPTYNLDYAGRDATPSEVMASSRLGQPTYLPEGTSLSKVKMVDDGSLAVLTYTNPKLERIGFYTQDVQIVIIAQRDGTSLESFQKILAIENQQTQTITIIDKDGNQHTENLPVTTVVPNRAQPIMVGSVPGYGYDPIYTPIQDKGDIQWWSREGIHYEVIANLPLQELVKIAESIPHI